MASDSVFQHESPVLTSLTLVSITNLTRESRISPIDMKLISDAHRGTLPQPDEYINHFCERSVASGKYCNREGMVIFVDLTAVHDFLKNHASKSIHPFVLVSGDSETSMPEIMGLASDLMRRGQILHW